MLSALGGFWIAVMQFNLLPSVAFSVMVICDKIVAGGRVLSMRGLIVQIAACVLTMAVHGFAFSPLTSMGEILATLPLQHGLTVACFAERGISQPLKPMAHSRLKSRRKR